MGRDWDPAKYAQFGGVRLRPALDLMAQVPDLPRGDVIDLGCGAGAVGPALAARFAGRRLIGVDNSPAMLAKAAGTGVYDQLAEADAARWKAGSPPALIFSNALIHWLPEHAALFASLAAQLAPGATLAVQMPRQYGAPSHALLRETAVRLFPERFDFSDWRAPFASPLAYARMLAPLGEARVWETEYVQRLAPVESGHPVRHFTQSTAMRPFLDLLDQDEAARFTSAYEAALASAYPRDPDGGVLMPFRRVFFVLTGPVR